MTSQTYITIIAKYATSAGCVLRKVETNFVGFILNEFFQMEESGEILRFNAKMNRLFLPNNTSIDMF